MRLSPVLVAVFAVSATFGLSNSANGQTSEPTSGSSQNPLGTSEESQLGSHERSLAVNSMAPAESFPLMPSHSVDDIVLRKTKQTPVDVPLSFAQSLGKIAASSLQNTGSFQFQPEHFVFNKNKPIEQSSLTIEPINSEVDRVSSEEIFLNKSKTSSGSERRFAFNSARLEAEDIPAETLSLNQAKSSDSEVTETPEAIPENSPEFDLENLARTPDFVIALNKSETEKIRLSELDSPEVELENGFPVKPAGGLGLPPEIFEAFQNPELELNKLETEKLAINLTENQGETSEILLNKYREKVANFSVSAA